MRPSVWYLNAALRTLRAFVPTLARPDDAFAARWLTPAELALYRSMDRRDRDHACRVAAALLADEPAAEPSLVRAAFLHDVGKADRPYRAWERIAVHLYRPGTPAVAVNGALAQLWRHHQRHPERGAAMILAAGGDPVVAEIVRHHHAAAGPPGSDTLRRIDERT